MRDIYAKAELVLSWLGHGSEEIDIAFEALNIIAKESRKSTGQKAGVEWLTEYLSWCDRRLEKDNENCNQPWNAIKRFYGLSYWRRVWIFQELVLAKHLLLLHGPAALKYEDLDGASGWLCSLDESINSDRIEKPSFVSIDIWTLLSCGYFNTTPVTRVNLYKDLAGDRRLSHDPFSIFYRAYDLQATDPRDHIYGLLGLTDCNIVPDYKKDLRSVLDDLVNAWLKDSNKLEWLLYAGVGTFNRGPYESLPSWAPNFPFISKGVEHMKLCFGTGHADQGVFRPTDKTPVLVDSVLHTSGLLGPLVVKVHEAFLTETMIDGRLYEFARDVVRRIPSRPNGMHPLKAIFDVFRTMLITEKGLIAVSRESMVRLAISVLYWLLGPIGAIELPMRERSACLGVPMDDSFANSFFNIFFPGQNFEKNEFWDKFYDQEYVGREIKSILFANMAAQTNFRFTEIQGGYLGIAPRFSRPNDVVAILKGFKVPVILRKQEDHYILIGTSTIPGLMEGEAKEMRESGQARLEEIQIR
jgi:hypothetical protein